jgi:regulator of replication initiation timing
MTANMATVRNLVQAIAGRDHAEEKAFALSKVREYEDLTDRESLLIESDERHIPNMDETLTRKSQIEQNIEDTKIVQRDAEKNLESVQSHYDAMKLAHDAAEERLQRKNDLLKKAAGVESEIENLKIKSDGLSFVIAGAQPAREGLEKDAEVKKGYEAARTEFMAMESRNNGKKLACEKASSQIREIDAKIQKIRDDAESAYRLAYSQWEKSVSEAKAKIAELAHQNAVRNQNALTEWRLAIAKIESDESKNADLKREIELIRKPCPNCGYLAPDVVEKIKVLESSIVNIPDRPGRPDDVELVIPIELLNKSSEKAPLQESTPIPRELIDQRTALESKTIYTPETMTMPPRGLSDSDIAALKNDIDEATRAEAEQKMILGEIIPSKIRDAESLRRESQEISVIPVDMSEENEKLASAKLAWSSAGEKISSLNTELETVKKDIQSIIDQREALEIRKKKLAESNEWLEAWRQADTMLSPAKIPAMELEASLDAIDGEATRMIQPYRNGRYIFETVTQKLGTKDTIDKFDIMIHDCETGTSKSFLNFSVGEKSFFNDAYVKSLVKIRKSRMRVSYSPIIMDEADSFIDIPMIPQFYEIQREYYSDSDSKVLIVSHSPEAGNFLQSVKSMDEIKEAENVKGK